jgi:hypothetical protein
VTLGHVCECGPLSTGGLWAEPGLREVPNAHQIGNPILQVDSELRDVIIPKAPETGGEVSNHTLSLHLIYEVDDPSRYLNPDCVADFTQIAFEQGEENVVKVRWLGGQRGYPKPKELKAVVGIMEGYIGEAMVAYSGFAAYEKAKISADIMRRRFNIDNIKAEDYRIDFVGVNATLGPLAPEPAAPPNEVMVRIAARTRTRKDAEKVAKMGDYLFLLGPAGTSERYKLVKEKFGIYPVLVPRDVVKPKVYIKEVK